MDEDFPSLEDALAQVAEGIITSDDVSHGNSLEAFLEHFGVKGMKWGIRKAANEVFGTSVKPIPRSKRKEARLNHKIKKTKQAISNSEKRMKIFEKDAQDLLTNGYKSAPMQRRYGRTVDQSYIGFTLSTGINRIDATQQLIVETGMNIRAEQRALVRNKKRLDKLEKSKGAIKHNDSGEETLEDVLEHFGIKGMKWGVRRAPKVDASSDDAKAATAANQKAKKTGVKSLSNQELQQLVNRMNLEQQLSRLKESQPSKFQKGKKIVQEIISAAKMTNDVIGLANSATGKIVKAKLGV